MQVLLLSNLTALLLQSQACRMGIVLRRDLAQMCRHWYPLPMTVILWILTELAIIATDLAEVSSILLYIF